ncbi:MAG: flagellar biosynthetic protein FliO [Polyangia bacterium]
MGASAADLPGLGSSFALSLVSLALVCLLAYLSLRWFSRRGAGRGEGPVRVLARCSLEPRRVVYLLQVAGRCFLVGVGDGPMSLLAEIDAAAVECETAAEAPAQAGLRFADVLSRFRGRPKS